MKSIRRYFRYTVCFAAIYSLFLVQFVAASPPRSVVLIISDGTGVSQLTSLRYTSDQFQFNRFPVTGLFTTHALDDLITDSAASGTAIATGHKTNNGMVATLPDGTTPKTILELAEDQGKSTGLVATSQITHATPACFGSHVEDRDMEMEIARQLSRQNIEVLFGGGQKFFLNNNQSGNLVDSMKTAGYTYVDSRDMLTQLNPRTTTHALGLFAEVGMKPAKEGRMPLHLMTEKAVEILANDQDGFFLMVEASQVDWEGHDNDNEGIIAEMHDMNDAVEWVLDYQEEHPDLLVLWISDHETGGYAIAGGSSDQYQVEGAFTSTHHTGQMIPAFAVGPGADQFSGVYDNTDIGKKLFKLFTGNGN